MMSRTIHTRAFCWTAASVASLLIACETNTASLLIVQNQVPGENCVVDSSASSTYRTQGVLDVGFVDQLGAIGYTMFPLVKNNMLPTEDLENGVVEENCLILDHVTVDLDLGGLSDFVESSFTKYQVGTSGTICPGELRAISVVVILPQVVEMLAGMLNQPGRVEYGEASVRVVARRGSQTIESATMNYPIFICNGCLIFDHGSCESAELPETPETGNPCNFAQDDRVDCCQSGTSELVCPAEAPTEETP